MGEYPRVLASMAYLGMENDRMSEAGTFVSYDTQKAKSLGPRRKETAPESICGLIASGNKAMRRDITSERLQRIKLTVGKRNCLFFQGFSEVGNL